jgi:hypothetical protein
MIRRKASLHENQRNLLKYFGHFFLEWEIFEKKNLYRKSSHTYVQQPPPPRNSRGLWGNMETYYRVAQATDKNTMWAESRIYER